MATQLLLACVLWATAAAWVGCGAFEGASGEDVWGGARRELTRQACGRWLLRLGSAPVPKALLGWAPWREAARALVRSPQGARMGVGIEEAGALLCAGYGLCCVAGLVLSGGIGVVTCAVMAPVALVGWAVRARRVRADAIAHEVPDAFRSLSSAMGAGRTLAQAVAYVGAHGDGELAREFGRASLEISCGMPASDALGELAERVDAPGVDLMVAALMVSAKTGAPLQGLFLRSAALAERRFELERELMAKTAQVRLSARIVCVLPLGLVGLLAMVSPDFRHGVATPAGLACVVVALVLDALALMTIRRLMKGVM